MPAIPQTPSTAKKLTYDISTQTLHLNPSSPTPTLNFAKDDHLILVNATALCKGELTWPTVNPTALFSENPDRDIIPGYDVSGIIIASPPNSRFKPGDEIIAQTRFNRPGNCREYSIARSQEMAPKPANLSWAEAASIPISALTAWQALFQHAGVKGLDDPEFKGKRILVIAAAGSVGIWLVQLAKLAGLKVVAQVGSVENEKLVRDLGATEVINYKTTSLRGWASQHGPVDIVFDLLGGPALEEAWYCVKDKGYLVSIVDEPESHRPADFKSKGVKNEFFIVESDGQQLAEISRMMDNGSLTTMVDSVWKLEDCEQAFARLEGGHPRGKVVIQVNE